MPQISIYIRSETYTTLKRLAKILHGSDEDKVIREMIREAIDEYVRKHLDYLRQIVQKQK